MILRRWLASVRTRLRGAAAELELDDELRTHLEMAVEEYLARGMSEREARRVAHRDLGGITAVKEARRQADSLYWLDTLTQDLRYGVRILRRSPRFTVAVVLILGVGVGMTTAVFAILDSMLLNAVPFAEAHRLVELHRFGPTGGGPSQPAAMVENWRNERALFDGVEAYVRVERRLHRGRRTGDDAGRADIAGPAPAPRCRARVRAGVRPGRGGERGRHRQPLDVADPASAAMRTSLAARYASATACSRSWG